ncbi:MAG: nicotinamide-nucleotide amidohydrolase family protein [Thermoleophilia bacterium]
MTHGLPTAAVVLSGSELLDGRVEDSNGPFVCADLSEHGVQVLCRLTVADDAVSLTAGLDYALACSPDILVVGGGLGTTHDDLTASCLADVLGVDLKEDGRALAMLEDSLRRVAERRQTTVAALLPQARRQALLPEGSRPLTPAGIAPGIAARRDVTRIFALPGVPHEFRTMWAAVAGELAYEGFFPTISVQVLRMVRCGELPVAAALATVAHDALEVGVTAGTGEVTVSLRYPRTMMALTQARSVTEALTRTLPVFSSDGRDVDHVVADALAARGETLAVAESCTGGELGGRITSLPGSSRYFRGGVICYANEVKVDVLGVPVATLHEYGAVSEPVAHAMATGVRALTSATYGVSITGVAGPEGGTPSKPVGTVYIGCSGPSGTRVVREQCFGDRAAVRRQATTAALHILREMLGAGEETGAA